MRTLATKARAINQYNGLGNQLWDLAGNRPSLDLPFAESKSLVDATTGTNLVDFTRASSGTYVGSDGLIKTATTNLLLRSEEFDNSTWVKQNNHSVTPNTAVAPDGTLSADTFSRSAYNQYVLQPVTRTGTFTLSAWVRVPSGTQTFQMQGYNVTDTFISATLFTATSQWQRFTITATSTAVTTNWYSCIPTDLNTDFYVWGAQLEQSSTVGEYIPTTSTINSAPRFDHDPTTGECLGLLVEESRINRFQWSNSAVNGETWNNVGALFNLQAGATDPAGGANGIIASDADNLNAGTFLQRTGIDSTLPANTVVTYSVWVKPISTPNNVIFLNLFANGVADALGAVFTNTSGVLTYSSSSENGTAVFSDASATPYPNGWYRLVLTGIPSTTVGSDMRARINLGSYQQVQGTPRFYWYGAQLETGLAGSPAAPFVTSYMPTNGSAFTRAANVASISGSNFSSWFTSPGENTFYTEYQKPLDNAQILEGYDGGNIVGMSLALTPTSPRTTVRHGPSRCDTGPSGLPPYIAGTNKHVGATSASGSAGAANGTVLTTGAPAQADWTATSSLAIGYRAAYSTGWCNTTIKRLTYWPTRLPNETLQTITT